MADKALHPGSDLVAQAKDILRRIVPTPKDKEILELTRGLKREKAFGYARKLLGLARESLDQETDAQIKLKLAQQHALCTYKDPDLPISDRLDRALRILDAADALRETKNQETLGLAGAIFKRKWEVDGQKQTLERSLSYYERGYQEGPVNDCGYTGLNAAYVLDLLASLEETQAIEAGTTSEIARERQSQAKIIRDDLVSVLPELVKKDDTLAEQYWFLVTIAEAYYGLGRFREALPWLEKAAALPDVPPWEFETTARQLTSIIRLQNDIEGKALKLEEYGSLESTAEIPRRQCRGSAECLCGEGRPWAFRRRIQGVSFSYWCSGQVSRVGCVAPC